MGQPSGTYAGGAQQPQPISEMDVPAPTLLRVTISHPQEQIPLGPDDYVLNSVFNHQMNAWEALVLVQPREDEEAPETEEMEEE